MSLSLSIIESPRGLIIKEQLQMFSYNYCGNFLLFVGSISALIHFSAAGTLYTLFCEVRARKMLSYFHFSVILCKIFFPLTESNITVAAVSYAPTRPGIYIE